jgi:cobalamin biosynthesis protein CobC
MDNPIVHGGNLHEASLRYGIPYAQWLDLSTGINPHGYPVPPVPADAWRRLPDDGDGFAACAARYYGVTDPLCVLPVAGSQAAIRALPVLLPRETVGIAPLTYSEYAPAFMRAEHRPMQLDISNDRLPQALTHVVVVNPNNPTADHLSRERLMNWHAQLTARGGTLIVDEAFADATPDQSLTGHAGLAGLVVMRSPGKFFGLAGARAGFVLGEPALLDRLRARLGAWTVSGPARHAVTAALADLDWQQTMRKHLATEGARLANLLRSHRMTVRATPLFAWTDDARAAVAHRELAQRGIWTRLFEASGSLPPSMRVGLPADEMQWQRLEAALADSVREVGSTHGHPTVRHAS